MIGLQELDSICGEAKEAAKLAVGENPTAIEAARVIGDWYEANNIDPTAIDKFVSDQAAKMLNQTGRSAPRLMAMGLDPAEIMHSCVAAAISYGIEIGIRMERQNDASRLQEDNG